MTHKNTSRKEELADMLLEIMDGLVDVDFVIGMLEIRGCNENDLRLLGLWCE